MNLDQKIEKLYFSIGEVSELSGIETYTLRYWETEFDELCPEKNNAGVRRYKKSDIEFILTLKELLHVKKFTIKGAREVLENNIDVSSSVETGKLKSELEEEKAKTFKMRQELSEIKISLKNLIDYLDD